MRINTKSELPSLISELPFALHRVGWYIEGLKGGFLAAIS
jgi:hypothetical protein